MKRRRLLILTGFALALAAMLPMTALAGGWAVVCTSSNGDSHIETAHTQAGCETHAEHPGCDGADHDHDPVPCEDRAIDLSDARTPDRSTTLHVDLLPVGESLFFSDSLSDRSAQWSSLLAHISSRAGPPLDVSTTVLRL